ncbi:MAG TPA: cupin domain-containing protein, partial [Devosia sp.]|nr:cupin domain-containing protein [Devosia sp.]
MATTYASPIAGLPAQMALHTGRATFNEAYALIPNGVMRDIVTSYLPHWRDTRAWIIARPLSGFAETFSQYIVEVFPGGGSERPEQNPEAEGVLFVVAGQINLTIAGEPHVLKEGGYAFLPPGAQWSLANRTTEAARFHWV